MASVRSSSEKEKHPMKRISIALALALALLVSARSQTPPSGTIKQVEVTSQTITSQPAGKSYLIDLTRNGTIYNVATSMDYSRVRVRTAAGEVALSEVAKQIGNTGGKLLIGTVSDMRARNPSPAGGAAGTRGVVAQPYTCTNSACKCTGFSDCLLMDLDNICKKGTQICDLKTGNCYCVKK
jgi:hypothetical protein